MPHCVDTPQLDPSVFCGPLSPFFFANVISAAGNVGVHGFALWVFPATCRGPGVRKLGSCGHSSFSYLRNLPILLSVGTDQFTLRKHRRFSFSTPASPLTVQVFFSFVLTLLYTSDCNQ